MPCSFSSFALRRIRALISSAIDQLLVDRQRAAVDLDLRDRIQHGGERHRVLDRVGQHQARAAALVPADPPAIEKGVDFELGGAEDELDPLAGPGAGDVVATALEAEE